MQTPRWTPPWRTTGASAVLFPRIYAASPFDNYNAARQVRATTLWLARGDAQRATRTGTTTPGRCLPFGVEAATGVGEQETLYHIFATSSFDIY